MKCRSPSLLTTIAALLALIFLGLSATRAGADSKETYWTSVEGVTIWARVTGLQGSTLLLAMRGREYRVPLGRLIPESAAKARRMLAIPADSVMPASPEKAREPNETLDLPAIDRTLDEPAAPEPADSPVPGLLLPPSLRTEPEVAGSSSIRLENRQAIALSGVPSIIQMAIAAGNRLQNKTYKWGGGRARLEDDGYDCSGSVSYILIHAGLLRSPMVSGSFTRYGAPGKGRWITIYARNGHVFMSICGLRLDTGGRGGRGESGPRWSTSMRGTSGFVMRHPPGL